MSLYVENVSFDEETNPHTPVFANYESVTTETSFLDPNSYRKKLLQLDTPGIQKYRRKVLNSEVSVRVNRMNKLMSPGSRPSESPERGIRSLSTSNNDRERCYLNEINHLNLKIKNIIRDKDLAFAEDLSKFAGEGTRNDCGLGVTFKPRLGLNKPRRFPKEVFCLPFRYRLH